MFYFKTLAYSALLKVSFFIYLLSSFFFLFGFKRYLDFTAFYFALALCSCIASCYKKPRNINSKPSRCCWSFVFISLSLVAIDCAKKGGKDSDAYVSIVKKKPVAIFFFFFLSPLSSGQLSRAKPLGAHKTLRVTWRNCCWQSFMTTSGGGCHETRLGSRSVASVSPRQTVESSPPNWFSSSSLKLLISRLTPFDGAILPTFSCLMTGLMMGGCRLLGFSPGALCLSSSSRATQGHPEHWPSKQKQSWW